MSLNKLGCSETLPGLSTTGTEDTAGLQNSGSCFVLSDHAWASSMDDAYPSPCMQPVAICTGVSWESYPSSIRTNSLANRLSQPRFGTVTLLFSCLCFSRQGFCVSYLSTALWAEFVSSVLVEPFDFAGRFFSSMGILTFEDVLYYFVLNSLWWIFEETLFKNLYQTS